MELRILQQFSRARSGSLHPRHPRPQSLPLPARDHPRINSSSRALPPPLARPLHPPRQAQLRNHPHPKRELADHPTSAPRSVRRNASAGDEKQRLIDGGKSATRRSRSAKLRTSLPCKRRSTSYFTSWKRRAMRHRDPCKRGLFGVSAFQGCEVQRAPDAEIFGSLEQQTICIRYRQEKSIIRHIREFQIIRFSGVVRVLPDGRIDARRIDRWAGRLSAAHEDRWSLIY
jgi:hypothetical protein